MPSEWKSGIEAIESGLAVGTSPYSLSMTIQRIVNIVLVGLGIALQLVHVATAVQQVALPAGLKQPAVAPLAISMELLANRPIIRAKVNGQGPFALLVVPEGQATLIDESLVTDLKLRPQKDGTATVVNIEIDVGSNKLPNVRANVGDMATILPEFGLIARPRGLLTASVWANQLVTLDYLRYQVVVEPGSLPEPNQRDVFASKGAGPEVGLAVEVAGHHSVPSRSAVSRRSAAA